MVLTNNGSAKKDNGLLPLCSYGHDSRQRFFFQFFLVMFVNDVVGRGNPLPVRLLTVRDARSVDFVFQTKKIVFLRYASRRRREKTASYRFFLLVLPSFCFTIGPVIATGDDCAVALISWPIVVDGDRATSSMAVCVPAKTKETR